MVNPGVTEPNFIVLRMEGKGPISMVTISTASLSIIREEEIEGIPDGWSSTDFFDLIDEGERFFSSCKEKINVAT